MQTCHRENKADSMDSPCNRIGTKICRRSHESAYFRISIIEYVAGTVPSPLHRSGCFHVSSIPDRVPWYAFMISQIGIDTVRLGLRIDQRTRTNNILELDTFRFELGNGMIEARNSDNLSLSLSLSLSLYIYIYIWIHIYTYIHIHV